MSEKNAKMDRKLKAINGNTSDIDWKKEAQEQARQIDKMYVDRDKKALGARDHLVSQLNVTSDKYRTANGVMAALQVVRNVMDGEMIDYAEEISIAKSAATRMAGIAQDMANKASTTDPDDMDSLCEGFYDPAFSEGSASALEMIDELLILQLCQNVGPNAEDVADFCKTADEEIAKARDALRELCTKHDINFHELCGESGDYLCLSCGKTCGDESKVIYEGQSAYDVCEDFVDNCEGE